MNSITWIVKIQFHLRQIPIAIILFLVWLPLDLLLILLCHLIHLPLRLSKPSSKFQPQKVPSSKLMNSLNFYIQVQFVYSFQSTRHPIMSRKLPSYPKKHMTVPKQARPDFKKKFLSSNQKNGEKYHHVPMDGLTLQHSITYLSISNTNGIMIIAHAK